MTRESSGTPSNFPFPKTVRLLKSSEFRKVYNEGSRISGPYFAAFRLSVIRSEQEGPRIGFTVPRAFGKSVKRNLAKRRIREILRLRLPQIDAQWDLVVNPRRQALDASPQELQLEVERLILRCGKR